MVSSNFTATLLPEIPMSAENNGKSFTFISAFSGGSKANVSPTDRFDNSSTEIFKTPPLTKTLKSTSESELLKRFAQF